MDTLLWHIWLEPTRLVAARVAVDLKLFETVAKDGTPKTLDDIVAVTPGASPKLVRRIARACVSMRMIDQKGNDVYVANKMTERLVQPGGAEGIIFCFETGQPSFTRIPELLRKEGFRNPQSSSDPTKPSIGPFQFGQGTKRTIFEWFTSERPDVFESFHAYIHAIREHRPSWTDMYPANERLVAGLKPEGDASAFIDIGGSMGQTVAEFRTDVPAFTGRLILQELPPVIEMAKTQPVPLDKRIELQPHDFFTAQPVKGARAYFLRMVLHDWSDDDCRRILGHLKDAMEPGYSRILICDCVVSDENAAWQHVGLDLFMMGLASSQERTRTEWHQLMDSIGLKIEGIYSKGEGNESLIEVVKP